MPNPARITVPRRYRANTQCRPGRERVPVVVRHARHQRNLQRLQRQQRRIAGLAAPRGGEQPEGGVVAQSVIHHQMRVDAPGILAIDAQPLHVLREAAVAARVLVAVVPESHSARSFKSWVNCAVLFTYDVGSSGKMVRFSAVPESAPLSTGSWMKFTPKRGAWLAAVWLTSYRSWYFSWLRITGNAVNRRDELVVARVSKPDVVAEVELNECQRQPQVLIPRLGMMQIADVAGEGSSQVGLNVKVLLSTEFR